MNLEPNVDLCRCRLVVVNINGHLKIIHVFYVWFQWHNSENHLAQDWISGWGDNSVSASQTQGPGEAWRGSSVSWRVVHPGLHSGVRIPETSGLYFAHDLHWLVRSKVRIASLSFKPEEFLENAFLEVLSNFSKRSWINTISLPNAGYHNCVLVSQWILLTCLQRCVSLIISGGRKIKIA